MNVSSSSPDVIFVRPMEPYCLFVELADGRSGVFDISPYLNLPAYQTLRDPGYFRLVRVEYGVICWPNEEDFSPDTVAVKLQS